MKHAHWIVMFLTGLLLLALAVPCYGDEGRDSGVLVRRLAVLIGANNGGARRPQLRYAETDAKEMSQVLLTMGGIHSEDHTLLLEPTKEAFLNAFTRLHTKISDLKQNYRRVEVVFYYSGHSDEEGLLLGGSKIPYKILRQVIENLDADLRIVILDSCASGAFTLLKGGKKQPPFLMDTSVNMTGYAFLTSSSSDEPSQESDQIKGSFFTHFLISALRGAADATLDGKITLNEAYQYAFRETLSRTENTLNGPQHPSYDIEMTGTGDVVMTDLRETQSRLVLGEDVYGRIYIHNDANLLIVELSKSQGKQIEIGLEPGKYRISVDQARTYYQTEITLREGERVSLSGDKFYPVKTETTTKRGGAGESSSDRNRTEDDDSRYLLFPVNFSVVPIIPVGYKTITNLSLSLIGSYTTRMNGIDISSGLNLVGENADGILAGGIGNYVKDNINGISTAGVFNINEKDLNGWATAGVFNITIGSASFWQAAGVFNLAGKDFNGFQNAGVFNYVGHDFNGFGAAGVFNLIEHNGSGFQTAGVFNYAGENFSGFQTAGVFNYAKKMDGIQCGAVNIAGEIKGLQIGAINIADKMDGVPIGAINLIKNGKHNVSLWNDETGFYNLGLKLGSKSFYNIYSIGVKTQSYFEDQHLVIDTKPELVSLGAGLGLSKRVWPFVTGLELLAQSVQNYQGYDITDNQPNLLRLRASVGLPLFGGVAIIAGYTYNYFWDNLGYESVYHDFLSNARVIKPYGVKCYAWPGYFVEIQL